MSPNWVLFSEMRAFSRGILILQTEIGLKFIILGNLFDLTLKIN